MTETMNLTTITAEDNQTRIVNIPTDKLQSFDGHPFKVEENADMESLIESIRDNGILTQDLTNAKHSGYFTDRHDDQRGKSRHPYGNNGHLAF